MRPAAVLMFRRVLFVDSPYCSSYRFYLSDFNVGGFDIDVVDSTDDGISLGDNSAWDLCHNANLDGMIVVGSGLNFSSFYLGRIVI
jgi:hypothetical protein